MLSLQRYLWSVLSAFHHATNFISLGTGSEKGGGGGGGAVGKGGGGLGRGMGVGGGGAFIKERRRGGAKPIIARRSKHFPLHSTHHFHSTNQPPSSVRHNS